MKEFKLASWPELSAPYQRTAYRRLLSDLSQRHLCVQQLVSASALSRQEVREFLEVLAHHGVLQERERLEEGSLLESFGGWLRRKFDADDRRP